MKDKWKGHMFDLINYGEICDGWASDVARELYDYIEELERKEKIADAVVKLLRMQDIRYDCIDTWGGSEHKTMATVDDLLKWAEENK